MVPEGREDDHEDVTSIPLDSLDPNNPDKLIKLNDSVPQKVKDISEFTFKIIDENGDELLGFMGCFQFLLQGLHTSFAFWSCGKSISSSDPFVFREILRSIGISPGRL